MSSLINTIFPKDVLVFDNDNSFDRPSTFLVVSTSDGKHMDAVNLEDCSLEGFRCLYGDELIKRIELRYDYEEYKFIKKGTFEEV